MQKEIEAEKNFYHFRNKENAGFVVKARPEPSVSPPPLSLETLREEKKVVPRVEAKSFQEYVANGCSFEVLLSRESMKKFSQSTLDESLEVSKFIIKETAILVRGTKKNVILTNFSPVPIAKRIFHNFKKTDEVYYEFSIQMKSSTKKFKIKITDIERFFKNLRMEIPYVKISTDVGKGEALFAEFLAEFLEEKDATLPIKHYYETGGWYKQGDDYHYFSALDGNCDSHQKLADISTLNQQNALSWAWHSLDLAELGISLPLFLFAHSGYVFELFRQAGIPIQFVFDIIGVTGSRKTSVSKVLYCLFQQKDGNSNFLNFTATPRSMEIVGEENKDSIVLLDDLSNSLDSKQLDKFEKFLRQICDQEGRRRSTGGGKNLDVVSTNFTAVLTAEAYFEELSQSSKLRNIAVFLDENSIQNSALTEFQADQRESKLAHKNSQLEKYMTGFIRYVETHWDFLLEVIASYQPSQLGIKFARLEESRRVFHSMALVVIEYAASLEMLSCSEKSVIFNQWRTVLDQMILQNQMLCEEAAPEELFLAALRSLFANGAIHIAENKSLFEGSPDSYVGFLERELVKLIPEKIYQAVFRYYGVINRNFSISANSLYSLLVAKGIAEGYAEKSRKNNRPFKKVQVRGKAVQFICIKSNFIFNEEE